MPTTVDQKTDADFRKLSKYVQLYDIPDFAKSASYDDLVTDEQSRNFYADEKNLQFPCHTKAATYISYIYFTENKEQFDKRAADSIQSRFDKFANFYGLAGLLGDIKSASDDMRKEAELDDSDYAIVWESEGGVTRQYPLRNAGEVKAAANWFATRITDIQEDFPWKDRNTIATKILDKAASYGVDVAEERDVLEKSAALGACDPTKAKMHIKNRARMCDYRINGLKESMEKLAGMIDSSKTLLDPGTAEKIAELLDHYDRVNNLVGKYTDVIPSPEDVMFTAPLNKIASAKEDICVLTTGTSYDRRDFEKLSVSELQSVFGDEIVEGSVDGLKVDPVKFAAIATTLPRPDAEILDSMMSRVGGLREIKYAHFNFEQIPDAIRADILS